MSAQVGPWASERGQNPDPTLPCISCEETPTPERTSDGYAICHECHTEVLRAWHGSEVHYPQAYEYDANDILTVKDLYSALTAALARGLDPDTAVVIGPQDHDWQQTSMQIGDPTLGQPGDWLWFTLFTAAPADPRSTPEHAYRCGYCGTYGHVAAECPESEVPS